MAEKPKYGDIEVYFLNKLLFGFTPFSFYQKNLFGNNLRLLGTTQMGVGVTDAFFQSPESASFWRKIQICRQMSLAAPPKKLRWSHCTCAAQVVHDLGGVRL
jgi:hypothetical protein